jgi:diacylglycerol kinase (ATP)
MKNNINKIFKNKTFIQSVNNAINGLKYSFRNEKNLRFHSIIAICVMIFSLFMDLEKLEFLVIALTISMVVITELINTAIEVIVNVMIKGYHPKAKIIKDVSAGAVLVASLNACIVAYIIFIDRIGTGMGSVVERLKSYPPNIILIGVLITVFAVIIVKIFTKKGTPFQGGMPSGHTAVAFVVATSVSLWVQKATVAFLCIGLALLVAQSRVEGKIHSIYEVIAGAVLGILVTLFLFNLIY